MVDLVLLQSLSYMAGALGVCVAAFYYALNIRETTRTRRVTLTNTLIQSFISEEGSKRYMDLMNMEWKDFDDFYKKYDSSVNPENFAKRNAVYNICDILGYQYLSGQLDLGTIWTVCNDAVPTAWRKFGPIIEEYKRRGEYYKHVYEHFEYLAYELSKIMAKTDPSYKVSPIFKSDEYYREFKRRKLPFASP
jgi:hypothetical protein